MSCAASAAFTTSKKQKTPCCSHAAAAFTISVLTLCTACPARRRSCFSTRFRSALRLSRPTFPAMDLNLSRPQKWGAKTRLCPTTTHRQTPTSPCAASCAVTALNTMRSRILPCPASARGTTADTGIFPNTSVSDRAPTRFSADAGLRSRATSPPLLTGTAAVRNEEEVPDFERQNEYLMLRLRTSDGVDLRDLEKRYNIRLRPL